MRSPRANGKSKLSRRSRVRIERFLVYRFAAEDNLEATMAGSTSGEPCSAHNCLKPRWKDGWCAAHWYAHMARLGLHLDPQDPPESLTICEAIWNAS